jgi:hypothetical protein
MRGAALSALSCSLPGMLAASYTIPTRKDRQKCTALVWSQAR